MFRPKPTLTKSLPLKPFAFRIREGHLVGLAIEPQEGAPCASCVESWLKDRNLKAEAVATETLPAQPAKALKLLIDENLPHTYYEVMDNGTQNRLDCLVFPHPKCLCNKAGYHPPTTIRRQTNLVLSPIFQLKCVRYGTPDGNLWYFTAMGQSPVSSKIVAAHAADPDKEVARFKTLNRWLKKVSLLDLDARLKGGEAFDAHEIIKDEHNVVASSEDLQLDSDVAGIGNSMDEAILDGLHSFTKKRVIEEFSQKGKKPMLIVGSNHWLRQQVPFFLSQQYDLYLLFYPNASLSWVVGIMALSRLSLTEQPHFCFGSHREIKKAMDSAISQILQYCRPMDWKNRHQKENDPELKKHKMGQLVRWWNNWVYGCPKISLKDILQLEAHPNTVEAWKEHLTDQGSSVSIIPINSPSLPPQLKTLVKVNFAAEDRAYPEGHNVRGIATWNSLRPHVDML